MGKMKILIISDSHNNIANIKHVMGFAKKIKAGAVIHCGDWNNPVSVDAVTNFNIPLYAVIGNADINPEIRRNLILKSEGFSEDFLEFKLGGVKIGITHKPSDLYRYFDDRNVDIIFCGHLHSKDENEMRGVKVVRPGALEQTVNFAVFDTSTKKVEFIGSEIKA
jgi:uncharacterized protein